ncbi:MAG: hypothetical protein KIS81_04220 [Maricaulaceae bacterium]|nr:hypothetical protein [Maricaulaceae bacterium]
MKRDINELIGKIRDLEAELESRLIERRRDLSYRWTHGRAVFSRKIKEQHRSLKLTARKFLIDSGFLAILTSPFIYIVVVPVALLDLIASLYQGVCFPVYGLRQVKRREYVVIDRHRLAYLNVLQKINCVYCGYANGVIAYVHEIASRTEQYWCPIKHAARVKGVHKRYHGFLDYGDVGDYPDSLQEQRRKLKAEEE